MAVSNIAMEKLLSTIVGLKASDMHITVGQPPVIRHRPDGEGREQARGQGESGGSCA